MKVTQCERIVQYMREFGSISTLEAFSDLGVTRLASRINDPKEWGTTSHPPRHLAKTDLENPHIIQFTD